MFYRLGYLCIAAVALLAGCKPTSTAPKASAAPPTEVAVSKPLQREVQDSLEYTGTTAAVESVEVRPRVTGFLEAMHCKPRSRVAQGDVLFTIDKRPFQISLDAAKAKLAAEKAKLELASFESRRVKELFEKNNASDKEMISAASTLAAIEAAILAAEAEIAQAELNLSWCEVTAPIAGRISRNMVDVGNVVAADASLLATITNDEWVYAYFNPSERDMLVYRDRRARELAAKGQKLDAADPGSGGEALLALMTDTDFPHKGTVDYVAPKLDESTGTVQVRAKFHSPDGSLVPGVFGRVRIPYGEPYRAALVTERALGSDQGQRFLMVVNDQNVVEQRFVKVGTLREGLRVIESGISGSDRVIVNGLQRVRAGVTVKPNEVPMPVGPAAGRGPVSAPASSPASSPATASATH